MQVIVEAGRHRHQAKPGIRVEQAQRFHQAGKEHIQGLIRYQRPSCFAV